MEHASILMRGFLLGVALSPTCLGVCLPLLVPFFGAEQRRTAQNWLAFLYFLGGRLLGYAVMGVLAGWAGREVMLKAQSTGGVEGAAFLLMGCLLVAYGVVKSFPHWSVCSYINVTFIRQRTPWLMGLLTGLNICPPFVAALFDASQAGGPVGGGLILVSFFAGTSLILLPLPFVGMLAKEEAMQVAGRVAAALVGLWFIARGLPLIFSAMIH